MGQYSEQVQRIKQKLPLAKLADTYLKVFGAGSHDYILNKPASEKAVTALEEKYKVRLPDCYKAFVLQVGNGGKSYSGSGAGPFYGIYPLGEELNELVDDPVQYLQKDCILHPGIKDEDWAKLLRKLEDDTDITDEEYEKETGRIFAGILPLGSQGCTYLHGLVLNGPHTGRVVNLSADLQKPKFAYEKNFLDWYERWLDEVISGDLQTDLPTWFGFQMGGTEEELVSQFMAASGDDLRNECISGLFTKAALSEHTIHFAETQYPVSSPAMKKSLLQLLCKYRFDKAKPALQALVKTDLPFALQLICWYDKMNAAEWYPEIVPHIAQVQTEEGFMYLSSLLTAAGIEDIDLVTSFTRHTNPFVRKSAFFSLRDYKQKQALLPLFAEGLQDPVEVVVLNTLQAITDVRDKRLLANLKKLAAIYMDETNYTYTNLNLRLQEYGLNTKTVQEIDPEKYKIPLKPADNSLPPNPSKKWYQFWK